MSEFQLALLIGLIITALISSRLPRARLWLACGAASFVLSTAYARYSIPHAPAFTLACDAALCLTVYFYGKERWEISGIYRIFQLSVLISLFRLSNIIVDQWTYIVALEILNWAALLLISGTSFLDRARVNEGNSDRNWRPHLHRPNISLRKARAEDPFHKIRH